MEELTRLLDALSRMTEDTPERNEVIKLVLEKIKETLTKT